MNKQQNNNADITVGQLIDKIAQMFAESDLFYGHGTDNPLDEAAAVVFHVLGLDHSASGSTYGLDVSPANVGQVTELAGKRIKGRKPLAYLLHEAWFCGQPFYVDERVLVPRSPVAELINQGFQPWVSSTEVSHILEIGTGSGCIAIACALAFPEAEVIATDISADALDVARRNVAAFNLSDRLILQQADLLQGVEGSYDIIISNPPYVPDAEQELLPEEYAHEPALGLFSGHDGLDSARRILQDAPRLLKNNGFLVIEVGAQWAALEQAYPGLPFTWVEFEYGGEGVAVIAAADLE